MAGILERIEQLADEECTSISGIETQIGASKGTLSRALAKGTDIQAKWLVAIAKKFPHVSLDWLISGEGRIYKYDPYGTYPDLPHEPSQNKVNVTDDLNEKADTFALMNEDLVPDVPIYALAGKTDDILEGFLPSGCSMLPRIPGVPRYDMTISVRGDSMEPTFVSGDRLAVRRVLEIYEWGAPYVLETEEGVYFKRVKNDGPNVICISDNQEYQPFKIEKDKIRSAYRVAAVLRIL